MIRPANGEGIAAAAALLRSGHLVAFPTETVYGLGADATNGRAVAAIFALKGRPRFNPLIVHVADLAAAQDLAEFTTLAHRLAAAFWPGPLTLVLKMRPDSGLSDLVTAGLDTVAVRVPGHPVALALLRAAGVPIAAPSANRSGRVSATTAEHVAADFCPSAMTPAQAEASLMILDGGPTPHGLESTILDATRDRVVLLRPGAIAAQAIEAVIEARLERAATDAVRPSSPGQLESHYAPRARVRLNAREVRTGEALLAFGRDVPAAHGGPVINLSAAGDLLEAAANLFAALRALDATGAEGIAVMPIPAHGLGEAINDRLRRAAAPRGPGQCGPQSAA